MMQSTLCRLTRCATLHPRHSIELQLYYWRFQTFTCRSLTATARTKTRVRTSIPQAKSRRRQNNKNKVKSNSNDATTATTKTKSKTTTTAASLSTTAMIRQNRHELLNVAIVGPPNAGKSTLFNRLLDKQVNRAYALATSLRRISGRLRGGSSNSSSRRGRPLRKDTPIVTGKNTDQVGGVAIVSNVPGTTRDRRECIGRLGGIYFNLVDTAGIDAERLQASAAAAAAHDSPNATTFIDSKLMKKQMLQQTLVASQQADLVLLMIDAKVGITNDLLETCQWLRKIPQSQNETNHKLSSLSIHNNNLVIPRRILILANKLEGDSWDYPGSPVVDHLLEATRVGLGPVMPISALQGEGMADLAVTIHEMSVAKKLALKRIKNKNKNSVEDDDDSNNVGDDVDYDADAFEEESNSDDQVEQKVEIAETKPLQLAILGRQNVGKSTLVNALLRQDRVLVGPTPGLTRDAIAIQWNWKKDKPVELVDTAGIRKRPQRVATDSSGVEGSGSIEDMAVLDAIRAMKVADVAVLVIDASAGVLHRQELVIADAILQEGRALVVAANKMDLIVREGYSVQDFANDVRDRLEARFPALRKTPVIPMCSKTGENVHKLMPAVFKARDRWSQTISTSQLNSWLAEVLQGHSLPTVSGHVAKIKYILQTKGRPPTFLLFCSTDTLPESYIRYLRRNFQDTFGMYGMEVRLVVKKSASTNPHVASTKTKTKKTSNNSNSSSNNYARSRKRLSHGIGGKPARRARRQKEQNKQRMLNSRNK